MSASDVSDVIIESAPNHTLENDHYFGTVSFLYNKHRIGVSCGSQMNLNIIKDKIRKASLEFTDDLHFVDNEHIIISHCCTKNGDLYSNKIGMKSADKITFVDLLPFENCVMQVYKYADDEVLTIVYNNENYYYPYILKYQYLGDFKQDLVSLLYLDIATDTIVLTFHNTVEEEISSLNFTDSDTIHKMGIRSHGSGQKIFLRILTSEELSARKKELQAIQDEEEAENRAVGCLSSFFFISKPFASIGNGVRCICSVCCEFV